MTVDSAGTSGLQVTETDTYVVGQESYQNVVTVANSGSTAATGVLYRAGDCYLQDSDFGYGIYDSTSGAITCTTSLTPGSRIEQMLPLTAGSNYFEGFYDTLWANIGTQNPFPNTCDCSIDEDNSLGLSWNLNVGADASQTFSSIVTFSPLGAQPLTLAKVADAATVSAGGTDGYAITATNPNAGAVTLAPLSDTLGAGFSFYQTGTTTGATTTDPTVAGQTLSWGSIVVPGGGTASIHFDVTASSTPGTYTDDAEGTATGYTVVGTGASAPVTVTGGSGPASTTTATSLSGGGQSGASISVPTDTAVTDAATLTGTNAALATGTVTYDVYSDSTCSTLAPGGGGTAESITTPGSLPPSASVTLSGAGTYYWVATYSGDTTNNLGSASACGAEVETVTPPPPQPTTTATSLSGGGQSGASISVPTNTAVTDTATLSGTNASTATGTVTYDVYSDSTCSTLAPGGGGTAESITTPGSLPPSASVTLSGAGTYYWVATYSGDTTNNLGSASACGAEVETVTSATTTPQPTTLKTHLSGNGFFGGGRCWWIGDLITVFAGTAVTDTATLSGTNASSATGTVTYTVYSWVPSWHFPFGQWKMVAGAGTVSVSNGSVPSSNPVTLPPGTYEWQATYSGDGANAPSMSRLGSETEYVIPVPHCSYGWNLGFDGGCRPCPNQRGR